MPYIYPFSSYQMRLRRASNTPCSSSCSLLGMKGRASPRQVQLISKSSTSWSTQVSSYLPILFLTLNLRLSTQKGSRIQNTFGGFIVSLRQTSARAFKYLYSFSPKQTSTISSERPICSILKSKHRNFVGFLAPPYSPPMHLSITALSMKVSAFRAKHSSFQYRELKIRLRVVLSMSCVAFFTSLITDLLQYQLIIMEKSAIKPSRLSASIILSLADEEEQKTIFLMLVRKPHMSFENSLVFPGGTCDKEDEAYSNDFHQFAKITAVRELMEETGILLLPPGYDLKDLSQLRAQYATRKLQTLNSLVISAWEKHFQLLLPLARFITPHLPKMGRFDCLFFLAMPGLQRINLGASGSLSELSIHIAESSRYYWATPMDYLQMMQQGAIFLPPPQRLLVHFLHSVGKEVYNIRPIVEPFLGQFGKGRYFVLPGDEQYDYDLAATLQPQSRRSQQIVDYIKKKKQSCKQGDFCRSANIFPVRQQNVPQPLQIVLNPRHPSILAFIMPSRSSPKL